MNIKDVRARRLARIIEDPECVDDLFAVAVVLASWIDFGIRSEPGKQVGLDDVQLRAFGEPTNQAWKYWRVIRTIKDDARTYRQPAADPEGCQAPTPRARRATCGRRYTHRSTQVDVTTGERRPLMACGRHVDWFQEVWNQNGQAVREARETGTLPLPYANHGGVLARHFPEIDWRKLWADIDPNWVQHPEATPWAKPTLTVHVGGAEHGGSAGSRRFTVIG